MAEEKRGYTISDIYQGSYSSMTPPDNAYINPGQFGMTTDFRTANILQEVSTKLASGIKNIEVSTIQPEVFDSIPKQQLKEVNRLAKLTGIDISLHAPLIEASGLDPRGGGFSEMERESAERSIANALLRSHDLNPTGNIPVTFHSSQGLPGSQFLPPSQRNKGENPTEYSRMIVVNKETGKLAPLDSEKIYYPGEPEIKKEFRSPEEHLKMLNHTEWDNTLSQIEFNRERVEEILKDVNPIFRDLYANWRVARINPNAVPHEVLEHLQNLDPKESEQIRKIHAASTYADQAMKSAVNAFDKAYTNCKTENEKKLLQEVSRQYGEILGVKDENKRESKAFDPKIQSEALFNLIRGLEVVNPNLWVPVEDFAIEKSSESFGNAAWEAYKKYKDTAPILSIENPPAGAALSTGEDVARIVEASRKKFIDKAKENGLSEGEARTQADKLIGATWDVGHINMLRKQGYSEKEVIQEAEKIAPVLKHVHLSDNFGFEHTELPMGMGNVPLKQIMEKLGQKGYDARKIIEAGNWWQHFKTQPFQETLEATGSPIYGMKMAPYWSQASGLYQGYQSGLAGNWLPQINYETFGTGFSRLPAELGGQVPGSQGSRMSGRPME